MLDVNELGEVFEQAVKAANPLAAISRFQRPYFGTDLAKQLSHVDQTQLIAVIRWACTIDRFKEIFNDKHPHWEFCKQWNKISAEYQHAKNKPQAFRAANDVDFGKNSEQIKCEMQFWNQYAGKLENDRGWNEQAFADDLEKLGLPKDFLINRKFEQTSGRAIIQRIGHVEVEDDGPIPF